MLKIEIKQIVIDRIHKKAVVTMFTRSPHISKSPTERNYTIAVQTDFMTKNLLVGSKHMYLVQYDSISNKIHLWICLRQHFKFTSYLLSFNTNIIQKKSDKCKHFSNEVN